MNSECKYQLKESNYVTKCMTEQEYKAYIDNQSSDIITILSAIILAATILMVISGISLCIARWVKSQW